MKYKAQDESQVHGKYVAITCGKVSAIVICHKTLIKKAAYFHANKVAEFQVFHGILHLLKCQSIKYSFWSF